MVHSKYTHKMHTYIAMNFLPVVEGASNKSCLLWLMILTMSRAQSALNNITSPPTSLDCHKNNKINLYINKTIPNSNYSTMIWSHHIYIHMKKYGNLINIIVHKEEQQWQYFDKIMWKRRNQKIWSWNLELYIITWLKSYFCVNIK